MSEEEKWQMSRGIADPDSNIEAKAAVTCFILFMIGLALIGAAVGLFKLVERYILPLC